jgi:heterodisulfide reductase subunit A
MMVEEKIEEESKEEQAPIKETSVAEAIDNELKLEETTSTEEPLSPSPTKDDEIRIGVFVCHCGSNIAGWVDVEKVEEEVGKLKNVAYVERNLYTCADDGLTAIRDAIKEHNLNRVIVSSCTPRTHAPLFKRNCERAGLNQYLFEFVNIREQCSWVHMKDRDKATQKATDLIRMGVARAALLEPQSEEEVEVTPVGLILGAGVAGMTAALSLANQGFEVHLIEKQEKIGGMLNELNVLYPGMIDASEAIANLKKKIESNDKIHIHISSQMTALEGYIGNYEATVSTGDTDQRLKVGTIIVATGADVYEPKGLYGYGELDNVVTQMEFEGLLKNKKITNVKDVVMIQCVGSRGQDLTYCSKICCSDAVKNAILIKEANPDAKVSILHNGLRVYGVEYEELYRNAQKIGIRFKKYSPEKRPEVVKGEPLTVKLTHELLGKEVEYRADYVVLSTPLIQTKGAEPLSKMLKVPLGQDKFFLEAHVKLRPIDFATDGIFLCGTAHAPADIAESAAQAYGAASRAAIPMRNGVIRAEAITSMIDKDKCTQCTTCEYVCPYGAIRQVELEKGETEMQVIAASCKGCGACASICPEKAITMRHYTDEQIHQQLAAALEKEVIM